MEIKGLEWKVSDRSIERLGVDVIIIWADDTRSVKDIRCDGNATSAMIAGLITGIHGFNEMLGYAEEFWNRPGFHDIPKQKRTRQVEKTDANTCVPDDVKRRVYAECELKKAFKEMIAEIIEHNREYLHRTPEWWIGTWEKRLHDWEATLI
jgi:hypothetical protein